MIDLRNCAIVFLFLPAGNFHQLKAQLGPRINQQLSPKPEILSRQFTGVTPANITITVK